MVGYNSPMHRRDEARHDFPPTGSDPAIETPAARGDPHGPADSLTSPSVLTSADDHFGFGAGRAEAAAGHGVMAAGSRCGGCTIVRLLAEGGMGAVYEARQDAPARPVAVKVMRAGLVAPDLARRFVQEADLLGRLRHPAVAQVHAAGIDSTPAGDRPYIVMELVADAAPITMAASRLTLRERATIFAQACAGVAHAHAQGIIHRDLKPANLLVDASGQAKVIDFGVGRSLALESERLTTASDRGELLGTVRYMSPEQLGVDDDQVDARSDVYALGLVLHELLTGELPHELRGRTLAEAAGVIARSAGVAVKPLAGRLARGGGLPPVEAKPLAAIVATCLEPSAADRYPNAGELAADLGLWLAGEPVRARPPSLGEALARLARRHRTAAAATVVAFAALVAAVAAVSAFWLRAERQREFAERAEAVANERRREADARTAEARRQLYLLTVLLAAEARDRGNLAEARRLLGEAATLAASRGGVAVELDCLAASLDGSIATLTGDGDTVSAVAWSPDGSVAAVGTTGGRLRTWHPAEPAATTRVDLRPHEAAIWDVCFSPDGRLLASASTDGTVRIQSSATGALVHQLGGHDAAVYAAAFSPDGSSLATAARDRTLRLWNTDDWTERATLRGHQGTVYSVRYAADGERLVSASQDGTVRIWSLPKGAETLRIEPGGQRVFRAAFSDDGRRVAAAGEDGSATVWDASTGVELARLRHPTRVNAIAFLDDGGTLATASGDGLLRCWDLAAGKEVSQRLGHADAIWSLAVRPLDAATITGSADGTVRFWDLDGDADPVVRLAGRGQALAVTADGGTLAIGDAAGRVTLIDPATLLPRATFETDAGRVNDAVASPDGATLVAACDDGRVHRYRLAEDRPLPPLAAHTQRAYCVTFSPDGRTIATGSEDRTARLIDAASGEPRLPPLRHPARVFGVSIHPDGMRLATACGDRMVRLWSLQTGAELAAWPGHDGAVNWVSFAPGGERLASASSDGTVRIWDVATGEAGPVLTGPPRQVWRVAFSADGSRVAATVADGTLQLWDAASGRPVAVLRGHRDQAWGVAFLAGGHALATASWDGTARLWGVSVADLARARQASQ